MTADSGNVLVNSRMEFATFCIDVELEMVDPDLGIDGDYVVDRRAFIVVADRKTRITSMRDVAEAVGLEAARMAVLADLDKASDLIALFCDIGADRVDDCLMDHLGRLGFDVSKLETRLSGDELICSSVRNDPESGGAIWVSRLDLKSFELHSEEVVNYLDVVNGDAAIPRWLAREVAAPGM